MLAVADATTGAEDMPITLPPPPLIFKPPPHVAVGNLAGDVAGGLLGGIGKLVLRVAVGGLGATLIIVGVVLIALDSKAGSNLVNAVPGGSVVRKAVGK